MRSYLYLWIGSILEIGTHPSVADTEYSDILAQIQLLSIMTVAITYVCVCVCVGRKGRKGVSLKARKHNCNYHLYSMNQCTTDMLAIRVYRSILT